MIKPGRGDMLRADVEALVNTVNCVGVMGRGVALQFKKAYPANFAVYEKACERGDMKPGRVLVFETGQLTNPKYIINFPTKRHWRGDSRLDDVEAGLADLVAQVRARGIRSIAIPPLGCGLGGLDWSEVRPRIINAFAELPEVQVVLFAPGGSPSEHGRSVVTPAMSPGRAVLVGLMNRYLAGLAEPWVTLLEVHKLMYFAQESGEPLRLKYVKATYGPYAENLRHVLSQVEGHLITGYSDGGDDPSKHLELVPGAVPDALAFLKNHPETVARFERVADLVEGFETPFGIELLASVHWVVAKEGARSPDEVVAAVHEWNERKLQFTPPQIRMALGVLQEKEWLA